jgi:signal transduction histidine kinase
VEADPGKRQVLSPGALHDLLVAAAAFALSLAVMSNGGIWVTDEGSDRAPMTVIGLVAVSTIPLVARRRHPAEVFAVTAAATAVLAFAVHPIGLPLGPGVALYTIAADRSRASLSATGRGVLVGAGFAAYAVASALNLSEVPWSEMFHGALLWAALWFAGERARLQREQIEDLKRDAVRERDLAAAEERTRIARDLHDSVGHAINVIAVRAGAARLRHHEDPERSRAALLAIEDLARHTAADIDQFVGALRSDADDRAPLAPRSLASVGTLIELHAEAGLIVTARNTGSPVSLQQPIDQAAYRIVQEALTNASRHGCGTADLAIHFGDDAVIIEVGNTVAKPDLQPMGHGLLGATERASLLGGSVRTECRGGVFVLRAVLPYHDAPAAHAGRHS